VKRDQHFLANISLSNFNLERQTGCTAGGSRAGVRYLGTALLPFVCKFSSGFYPPAGGPGEKVASSLHDEADHLWHVGCSDIQVSLAPRITDQTISTRL